jgi:hypothetical protein
LDASCSGLKSRLPINDTNIIDITVAFDQLFNLHACNVPPKKLELRTYSEVDNDVGFSGLAKNDLQLRSIKQLISIFRVVL